MEQPSCLFLQTQRCPHGFNDGLTQSAPGAEGVEKEPAAEHVIIHQALPQWEALLLVVLYCFC